MSYTVNQLAKLAGVSVRTLHHYDEIGLLKPARVEHNNYRYYEDKELLELQQILFFRELDFSLGDIKRIMSAPGFDISQALRDQKKLLKLKQNRLDRLVKTIDKTLQKINKEKNMDDKDLYGNFSKAEMERCSEEARQRWGDGPAFQQSQQRLKKMGRAGLNKVVQDSEKLAKEIAGKLKAGCGPGEKEVQQLIAKHYDGLRAFYEPNLELYHGLANLYVNDERFKAYYEKIAPGLAQFMYEAMLHYVKSQLKRK